MITIEPSDSFIATVQELKERLIIDDEINPCVHCAICGETSFEKELWFVLENAGSGSMNDYICSDCIKKINDAIK